MTSQNSIRTSADNYTITDINEQGRNKPNLTCFTVTLGFAGQSANACADVTILPKKALLI